MTQDMLKPMGATNVGWHDVVLINPPHHGPDYYSPIGINMLATLVRAAGMSVRLVDFQQMVIREGFPWPEGFFVAARAYLMTCQTRVFGFSVMNVGFPWAVELAALAKNLHPSSTIIFGGPHATLLAREIIERYRNIDIVACYEGETIVVRLMRAILEQDVASLYQCPNLVLRDQAGAITVTARAPLLDNLDDLPLMQLEDRLLGPPQK